jgi:hypothetical protein
MNHNHFNRDHPPQENKSSWSTKVGIVTIGFLLVIGFFLLTEHWAHLYGYWPFLFLLACPLMHLFMHHEGHQNNSKGHRH